MIFTPPRLVETHRPPSVPRGDARTRKVATLLRDSVAAARAGSLAHVSCDAPAIRRTRVGRGFAYFLPNGKRLTRDSDLRRIATLAIPPAWRDVRICTKATGHLQCTGYDARGRKQYRYHARWREVRDEAKYSDILLFAATLPKLRHAVDRDMSTAPLT
jgi:DNA topoisomerase-1